MSNHWKQRAAELAATGQHAIEQNVGNVRSLLRAIKRLGAPRRCAKLNQGGWEIWVPKKS